MCMGVACGARTRVISNHNRGHKPTLPRPHRCTLLFFYSVVGAERGARTLTSIISPDFESSASTNFAISALSILKGVDSGNWTHVVSVHNRGHKPLCHTHPFKYGFLVRMMGVEPIRANCPQRSQRCMSTIPSHPHKRWHARRDSNPSIYPLEAGCLNPVWPRAHNIMLAHQEGLEPSTFGSEVRRSIQLSYWCTIVDLVPAEGIEPPTFWLQNRHSSNWVIPAIINLFQC
jgi:hypothetical protein